MTSFSELKINKSILKVLDEIGFEHPTPIQEKAIPIIKSGMDVVGVAQTGTGKTAAYLLPIFSKLVKAEGEDPRVLILVPTRELAIQVGEDIEELTPYSNIRHAAVFGGVGWTKHAAVRQLGSVTKSSTHFLPMWRRSVVFDADYAFLTCFLRSPRMR